MRSERRGKRRQRDGESGDVSLNHGGEGGRGGGRERGEGRDCHVPGRWTHTHKHRTEEDLKTVNTTGRGYTFFVLKSNNGGKATLSPVSLPQDQRAFSTRNPHRYADVC